jgi:hypothetical protein
VSEIILFLWEQATEADVLFSLNAVHDWPSGMLERLQAERLLIDGGRARFIPCDDCDGEHVEPVEWHEYDTETQPFIRCPTNGRTRINLDRLQQWKVNPGELAKQTANRLSPNLSKECFRRIQTGRFTEADRADILELLSGLPAEGKLKTKKSSATDLDAKRLASVTDGLPPQATILLRSLWSTRAEVHWSELPDAAFVEGPARSPDVVFESLKRLRTMLAREYDRLFLILTLSKKKRTVELIKDPIQQGGK